MKSLLLFGLSILPVLILAQNPSRIWSNADQQYLINGLKDTQSSILHAVEGLSEKQMQFKSDSSQWSIAEVVEHIGVYEELLYWDLLNNQYTEERPDLVEKVKGIDTIMIAYATDPNKGVAPFAAQPIGRFQTKQELLGFFNRFRNAVVELIQETSADFRLHFVFRPPDWGVWHVRDLHQYTLVWIAHTERHLGQIERIKVHQNFPK
jgi:DinB superfamily